MKKACFFALETMSEVEELALDNGIFVKVSVPPVGKVGTVHVMFNDLEAGERILNFWPATGTWSVSGKKGKSVDAKAALEVAIELAFAARLEELNSARPELDHLRAIAAG